MGRSLEEQRILGIGAVTHTAGREPPFEDLFSHTASRLVAEASARDPGALDVPFISDIYRGDELYGFLRGVGQTGEELFVARCEDTGYQRLGESALHHDTPWGGGRSGGSRR